MLFQSHFTQSRSEEKWLLKSTLIFLLIRWISLFAHYFGVSPYGGPLLESPLRFVFNAAFIESGVILGLALFYRIVSLPLKLRGWAFRVPFLLLGVIYLGFTQLDLEFVRWLGEHITVSFVQNYFRATDGHMLGNLLDSDLGPTLFAVTLIIVPFALSVWLLFRKWTGKLSGLQWLAFVVMTIVLATSPLWFMQSDKRWRRICPVAVSMSVDLSHNLLGLEKPKNPLQAYADLLEYVNTGHLATKPLTQIPQYPFYHEHGPGKLNATEFQKLPQNKRPNIVYITFETWRGWKTGLVHDSTMKSITPHLDSLIEKEGYYFPYVHSLGFPSVEGTQNIHLGTWPHFRKIVISSYLNINWKSLPECFHELGYTTQVFVGADPSFSNLTPWFRRWYEYTEYSYKYTQDGPLLERFSQALDTISRNKPFFLSTWTVTTHPPYTIPESEGIPIAKTDEERYDQALAYAEKQILKVINHLKKSDLWDNTIVVIVGDHAQPETSARNNTDVAGSFTPGHTWVHAAFLGGWPGLPQPKRNEETVASIDIAPTLLEMVDADVPNHFMGHSMLHPRSQEFLSFRWNTVALHQEEERLLFDMFSDQETWFKLNKKSKRDYTLLTGHQMPKKDHAPWPFDKQRYRDMIFAFGELMDEDRMMPPYQSHRGDYQHK